MSLISGQTTSTTNLQPGWTSSFRRTQLALALWGLLLVAGGWLHNHFGYSRAWDTATVMWMWLALAGLGLLGSYLLNRDFLGSGMLWLWGAALLLAFAVTWLFIFPLNLWNTTALSAMWHWVLAAAYYLTGRYMDRRWWWLTGWEFMLGLLMLLAGIDWVTKDSLFGEIKAHQALVLGLSSGLPLLLAALPFWKERYARF